ncbi:MAG: hypothetical protein JO257_03950 [Deltaproteobacteria bacterium]|nr:hypothetical protein [Deltaproteobacteria bacterium]
MSLRALALVVLASCASSSMTTDPNEPQTAKEKQLREAKEKGELDAPRAKSTAWDYAGDRKDCFYVVGRRCFKTQKAACTKACGSEKACKTTGAGPAAVSCNRKKG